MRRINKKKDFWVIAYDIADDCRRSRIVKHIEKYGIRVNYSVFECMLTDTQLQQLREKRFIRKSVGCSFAKSGSCRKSRIFVVE